MAVLNNLFPPSVSTYVDTFLTDSSNTSKNICKVYFSISDYNIIEDISNVQIIVRDLNTNMSLLNQKKYPCEIMISNIKSDLNGYYIEINPSDLEKGKFEVNKYYKIQLRFTGATASQLSSSIGIPPKIWNGEKYTDAQAIDSWLTQNLEYFSEWSTITIAHPISTPELTLKNLDENVDSMIFSSTMTTLNGKISFKDIAEKETLDNYKIELYNNEIKILDSDNIYTSKYENRNEINYTFNYEFQDGEEYSIVIYYMTNSGYKDNKQYTFNVIDKECEKIDADLNVELDYKNGRTKINIFKKSKTNEEKYEKYIGNITIRRTSNDSNFTVWEDVYTFAIENEPLNYTWYDYTIESGIIYKYGIQKRNSIGLRGTLKIFENILFADFENIFLNGNGKQLCIKYNPQIQSFQRTHFNSKTDTIGSKYPIIKNNANCDYKQFNLSGLITAFMDEDNIFSSKEEIYKNNIETYSNYNAENNINDYMDVIYEKKFREKVMNFLYNNNIKLYRSPTEGNILIKITDVSFTPETSLGRQLYSFNCTAYEVDKYSIDNCNNYNIQYSGKIDTVISYQNSYIGRYDETIEKNKNILKLIESKYSQYKKDGFILNADYFDYLKIEMQDEPYLINEKDISDEDNSNVILGYLVYINNQPVVINKNGILELKGEKVNIQSVYFDKDTSATIDYNVYISQVEDTSSILKSEKYYRKVGQEYGVFDYKQSIYKKIWNKYYINRSDYLSTLILIDNLSIYAEKDSIFCIVDENDYTSDFIIDEDEYLNIDTSSMVIKDFYFKGYNAKNYNISTNSINENTNLSTLENNTIYNISSNCIIKYNTNANKYEIVQKNNQQSNYNKCIYYNETLYPIENECIVKNVNAIIDYSYEKLKGVY